MKKHDRHTGSSFDSFLENEGILEEVEAVAIKRVIAWQIEQEMAARHITKKAMAERLHTSRSQLERLLDPSNIAVQLVTVVKAAHTLGLRMRIEMEHAPSHSAAAHAIPVATRPAGRSRGMR